MKRTLSVILAVLMLLTALPFAEVTAGAETYTYKAASASLYSVNRYISVIEDEIAAKAYDFFTGSGFLYDIDSDGVDELVILNIYAEVGGNSFPGHAYSVYDIENGEVIAKCDKELLFYDAGAPKGYVGVVNYLGSKALVVYIDNGGTDEQAHRESLYTIYDTDSFQVIASASIDYVSYYGTIQVNNCTVNGSFCSYNDYLNFVDAIEPIMISEVYSNDGTDGSMDLYELLRFIQETSSITPELGNVNGDEEINATDATLVLQYFAKIITDSAPNFDSAAANVNNDAEINATDATLILQYFAKIITSF